MIMKKKKKKMTKKKDCSGSHHKSKFKNGKKDKYEKSSLLHTQTSYLGILFTERKSARATGVDFTAAMSFTKSGMIKNLIQKQQ